MLILPFAPPFQDFCAKDYGSWERMVSMNILGYLFTIGEFLPEMRARGSGHLVNISSDSERAAWPGEAAGHVSTPSFPAPGFTVYTGTKFFWAGASEALRKELTGSGVGRGDHVDCLILAQVRLTNILPGFVWTEGLRVGCWRGRMRCFQAMLTEESSREDFRRFGLGDPDEMLRQVDLLVMGIKVGFLVVLMYVLMLIWRCRRRRC